MVFIHLRLVLACAVLLYAQVLVCGKQKIIDLSHPLNSASHRWPTQIPFNLTVVANGTTANGWYASNDLCFSEHTGTHLDAPAHFASRPGIYYSSTIPAERLVGPLSVINLADKAAANRDYLVTASDITDWENKYWKIPEGGIVLFDFAWAQYWDSYEDVFGSASTDTTTFHFPGIGIDAAEVLAERQVYGVGIDTPSADYGQSQTYPVHYYLLDRNIYFLENVGDMSALPEGGESVTLVVGAMKIDGGTGGPARLIAMYEDNTINSASRPQLSVVLYAIIASIITYVYM